MISAKPGSRELANHIWLAITLISVTCVVGCGGKSPSERLIGTWQQDEKTPPFRYTFASDGSVLMYLDGKGRSPMEWKVLEEKDDVIIIFVGEVSKTEIEFIDDNNLWLRFINDDGTRTSKMKLHRHVNH